MRTTDEQQERLEVVARIANTQHCDVTIQHAESDIMTLVAYHQPSARSGSTEIVAVSGDYDVWQGGSLVESDLSADEAAARIVTEYRNLKAEYVADRWIAQGKVPADTPRETVVEAALQGILSYQGERGFLWSTN